MAYAVAVVTLLVAALAAPVSAAAADGPSQPGPTVGTMEQVLTFLVPRFPPGHNCTAGDQCVEHAVCNVTEDSKGQTICVCVDSHYSDYRTCLPRLAPGAKCSWAFEDMCVLGAVCHCDNNNNNHCQCDCAGQLVNDFYNNHTNTCQIRSRSGDGCDDQHPCVDNAFCGSDGQCECLLMFYFDHEQFCRPRILANHLCNETQQCVQDAQCDNSTRQCKCDRNFYVNDTHQCSPKLALNSTCSENKQCLVHGECFHGVCRCDNQSYTDRSQCHLTLGFNDYCDYYNTDPLQCVSNTSCVFRATDDKPKCGCDTDHFYNGQFCVARAKVNEHCPLGNATTGIPEVDKQCVDNAHCNTTSAHCECLPGHYYRSGRCPLRIAQGGTCDPWSSSHTQCQEGLACQYGTCRVQSSG